MVEWSLANLGAWSAQVAALVAAGVWLPTRLRLGAPRAPDRFPRVTDRLRRPPVLPAVASLPGCLRRRPRIAVACV